MEDEEAIVRANMEMETAAKEVKRLLQGRAVRSGRVEFLSSSRESYGWGLEKKA